VQCTTHFLNADNKNVFLYSCTLAILHEKGSNVTMCKMQVIHQRLIAVIYKMSYRDSVNMRYGRES